MNLFRGTFPRARPKRGPDTTRMPSRRSSVPPPTWSSPGPTWWAGMRCGRTCRRPSPGRSGEPGWSAIPSPSTISPPTSSCWSPRAASFCRGRPKSRQAAPSAARGSSSTRARGGRSAHTTAAPSPRAEPGRTMTVQSEAPVSRLIRIHEVAWENAGPGLQAKPLWGDPLTQRRAYLGRIAPGTKLPLHRHLGDELVFVIEGDVSDESGTLIAGQASYRPKGCVHTVSTERGTTVLIVVTGGMEPAESMDGAPASIPIDISRIDWVEAGAELPAHRHLGDALLFGIEGESGDESGATPPGCLSYRPDGYVHSVRAPNGATTLYYAWGATEAVDGGSLT